MEGVFSKTVSSNVSTPPESVSERSSGSGAACTAYSVPSSIPSSELWNRVSESSRTPFSSRYLNLCCSVPVSVVGLSFRSSRAVVGSFSTLAPSR